jgi:hypothetical protein
MCETHKNDLQTQAVTKRTSLIFLQSWNPVMNSKRPDISPDAPQICYAKAPVYYVIIS